MSDTLMQSLKNMLLDKYIKENISTCARDVKSPARAFCLIVMTREGFAEVFYGGAEDEEIVSIMRRCAKDMEGKESCS